MANKFPKVLTCGCDIASMTKSFSQYKHSKGCTCESIGKGGKVKKFKYDQISIFERK